MSIKRIKVFESTPPAPDCHTALLHLADASEKLVETAVQRGGHGFHTSLTFGVRNYADLYSRIAAWLQDMDFQQDDITLAIYSDCTLVSAMDAAFIAHVVMPDIRMESSNGELIEGFRVRSSAIFEHDAPLQQPPRASEVCHG